MPLIKDTKELLSIISKQEKLLSFPEFNNDIALKLGTFLVDFTKSTNRAVSISITVNQWQVFKYAMSGATRPDNEGWLERKHNTVTRFRTSSLATAATMKEKGSTLADRGLSNYDYVFAGGGVPLNVAGAGIIGSICASGLADFDDHQLLMDGCAKFLEIADMPSVVE